MTSQEEYQDIATTIPPTSSVVQTYTSTGPASVYPAAVDVTLTVNTSTPIVELVDTQTIEKQYKWKPSETVLIHRVQCSSYLRCERECTAFLGELFETQEKCSLCHMLVKTIRHFHLTSSLMDSQGELDHGDQDFETERERQNSPTDEDSLTLFLFLSSPGGSEKRESPKVQFYISSGSSFLVDLTFLTDITLGALLDSAYVVNSPPQHSNHQICFETIRCWMKECKAHHTLCRPSHPPSVLPSRGLDIGSEAIRLQDIQSDTSDENRVEYLTLSHCWGLGKNEATTKNKNLAERKKAIHLDNLNQTFRDAIFITRELGYRYFWVDSLCIIQDDTLDWQHESGHMAAIYENSDLTICATHAEDGSTGIFSDRHNAKARGSHSPWTLEPWNTGVECMLVSQNSEPTSPWTIRPLYARLVFELHFRSNLAIQCTPYTGNIELDAEREPLLSRAWVLQERLLSQRRLDYLTSEIVWECRESRKCECEEADMQPFKTPTSQFIRNLTLPINSTEVADIWRATVEKYASLSITYPEDKLPALSRLAQRVAQSKRSPYLAGLWGCDLPEALLWYPATYTGFWDESPWPQVGSRHEDKKIPTWSWASVRGSIMFWTPDWQSWRAAARVIDLQYQTNGEDPFGRCGSASLTLAAPAIEGLLERTSLPAHLDSDRMSSSSSRSSSGYYPVCYYLKVGDLGPFEVWPDIDMFGLGTVAETLVLCLFIGRDAESMCGLMMRGIENSDDFERVGFLARRTGGALIFPAAVREPRLLPSS